MPAGIIAHSHPTTIALIATGFPHWSGVGWTNITLFLVIMNIVKYAVLVLNRKAYSQFTLL